jgi:hypothetical protein
VCQKQGFEVDDLFAKLRDGSRQSIILCAKDLNFGLQISKPLLLTLATFESSDATIMLDMGLCNEHESNIPVSFKKVFPLLLVCHFPGGAVRFNFHVGLII